MVISDHHLAVLSFAAFCRFLDGIAGTDKVDETLEEFMEWSGFAVSLEEVREKASQPLAEEERAVLLACWRKFLDLGVPVDEQTVGTAAGAEAPGKEVAQHTYLFLIHHAFQASLSFLREKHKLIPVLGFPVASGTAVQTANQIWGRLTEAEQAQFTEMFESAKPIHDAEVEQAKAEGKEKKPGLTGTAMKSYFEAHEEHFTDLATMVAGAVKEHNDCVTSFRALAKPHVAPLTDERMKSLPAKCMAKEYVPDGKVKQAKKAKARDRVAFWNGLRPEKKDDGRADSVWIAMADTDERMELIETHKTAYRASTEMPPQAHMKANKALTKAIQAAVKTLVDAADAEGAPAHTDDEPSSAKPKSTSKKRGHSKTDVSPSVHRPDTPDVPTASQEQPHRHTGGSPGDGNTQAGTQGGTQAGTQEGSPGNQVANLGPVLANADKLFSPKEGTPCGNTRSADKAKLKEPAEAVTAPQQERVTNKQPRAGGASGPAGAGQAVSSEPGQPAPSAMWPPEDTDNELLQALLEQILANVHRDAMKKNRENLQAKRVLLVNCHPALSAVNSDGGELFPYVPDSLKLDMTERVRAYRPIVKEWKNMRTRTSKDIRYDFVTDVVKAYQKDPACSGDWKWYKKLMWDVCSSLHRHIQSLKGFYFAMRAKCGIPRLDLPPKHFWLSDMRFQCVWEGLGSDGQELFDSLYYKATKDLGDQYSLIKHRECFEAHYEKDPAAYTEILARLPDVIAEARNGDTGNFRFDDLIGLEEPCGLEDEALAVGPVSHAAGHDAEGEVQVPLTGLDVKGIHDTDIAYDAAGDGDGEGMMAPHIDTGHKDGDMPHASGAQSLQPPTTDKPLHAQREDDVQTAPKLAAGNAKASKDSPGKASEKQRRKEEKREEKKRKEEKRAKRASKKSKSGAEGQTQTVAEGQGQAVSQRVKADKKRPSGHVVPKAGAEPSKRLATAAAGSPAGTAEAGPSGKGAGKRGQAQPPSPGADKKHSRESKAQRSPSGKTEATQPAPADKVGKKRSAPEKAGAETDKSRSKERSPKKQKRTDTQPKQPTESSHTPVAQAAGTTAQPPAAAGPPPPKQVNTPHPKKSAAAAAASGARPAAAAPAGGAATPPKAAKAAAPPAAPAPTQAAPATELQRPSPTTAARAGAKPAQAPAKTTAAAKPPQQAGTSHQGTQAKKHVQASGGGEADDESDSESEGQPAVAVGARGKGAGVRTPSVAGTSVAAQPAYKAAAAAGHKPQAASGRGGDDSSSSSEGESSFDEDDGAKTGKQAAAPSAAAAQPSTQPAKVAQRGAMRGSANKDKGESSSEDESSSEGGEGEGEGDSSSSDESETSESDEEASLLLLGKRKVKRTAVKQVPTVAAVPAVPEAAAPVPPLVAGRAQVTGKRPAASRSCSSSSSSSESESDSESAPATKPAAKGTARAVQAPASAAKPAPEGAGTATAPVNAAANGPSAAGVKQKGSAPAASPTVLAKAATKAAGVAAGQQQGAEVTNGATPGRAGKAAKPAKAPAKAATAQTAAPQPKPDTQADASDSDSDAKPAAAAGPVAEGSGCRTGGTAGSQAPSAAGRSRQAAASRKARTVADTSSDDEGSGSGSGEDGDSSDEGEAADRAVQAPAKPSAAAAGSSPPAAAGRSGGAGSSKGKSGSGNEGGRMAGNGGKSEEEEGEGEEKKLSTAATQAAAASTPAHFAAHAGDPAQAAPPHSQRPAGSGPVQPHASADSDSSSSSDESSSSESSSESDSSSDSDSSSSESDPDSGSSSGSDSEGGTIQQREHRRMLQKQREAEEEAEETARQLGLPWLGKKQTV